MRTADNFLHILHVKGKHSKKILKAISEKFTSRLPPIPPQNISQHDRYSSFARKQYLGGGTISNRTNLLI
jgi:hypothetical protein